MGGRSSRGKQQGVDAIGNVQILLQPPQWNEDGPHVALLWLQREITDLGGGGDCTHGEAHGSTDVVLPAMQRFDGNR